jgi:hypothetical protein
MSGYALWSKEPKKPLHERKKIAGYEGGERDIGTRVRNNLKPSAQCKKAAQTANAVLGQLYVQGLSLKGYAHLRRVCNNMSFPTWNLWYKHEIHGYQGTLNCLKTPEKSGQHGARSRGKKLMRRNLVSKLR